MHVRNQISAILIILSFALLVPGVTQPVFNLSVDVAVASKVANLQAHVLDESRSILGTVRDLFARDRLLVAALILLFSVIVPVLKGLILLVALPLKSAQLQLRLINFVNAIAKWSMADVFVVAIFLVYLSTKDNINATQESISVFGMKLPLEIRMLMDSDFGTGFYWFLGYCLLSMLTLHLVKKPAI